MRLRKMVWDSPDRHLADCGWFEWNGKLIQGRHEALIPVELWEREELARQLADRPQVSNLAVGDGSLPPVDRANLELHGGALPGHHYIDPQFRSPGGNCNRGCLRRGTSNGRHHPHHGRRYGEDMPGDVPGLLTAAESHSELSVVVAKRIKRSELTFDFLLGLPLLFLFLTRHRISFGNFLAILLSGS
jgi:hypothetical protein